MKWMLCKSTATLLVGVSAFAAQRVTAAPPAPLKVVAVVDATQNFGSTQRAINFYDVTTLTGGSVFGQTPLFSVWPGYEMSASNNFEETDTIAVNPANGTMYMASFDSGPTGVADPVGDTQGDYDLYKIDYQSILNDFQTNHRAKGTMYAPTVAPDGTLNNPHPAHPVSPPPGVTPTVFLNNAVQKIGEVARVDGTTVTPFFNPDLEFINPANLAFLGDQIGDDAVNDDLAHDHQIRMIHQVSSTPGASTFNATTAEGGFNGNTTQSWESKILTPVGMDPAGRSEPVDMAVVQRDGVTGVWVADADGGGDDVSFFKINMSNLTAAKEELKVGPGPYPTGFALSKDPVANPGTADGHIDTLHVNGQGNLVIGASGFFDAPATQPYVIGREVQSYNSPDSDANGQNEVKFGAWSTSAHLNPTLVDDASVIDGRYVAYDKGTGRMFYFDPDSGAQPNVVGDAYVFDPATGTMVYQELNAANHLYNAHGFQLFVRGDINNDGVVNSTDIDNLFAHVLDPTLGGTVTSAIGQEWFDLTGNGLLTGIGGDVDELVTKILGTTYGDTNLDGQVNFADFQTLQNNFNGSGKGWAEGDFNGDKSVNFADFQMLQNHFGFSAGGGGGASVTAVPEPSSIALIGFGGVALLTIGRRRLTSKSR